MNSEILEVMVKNLAFWGVFFFLIMIWSSVWKAIALWKEARNHHVGWFVALFIINTVGILEIIYIFLVSRKRAENTAIPTATPEVKNTTI